MLIDRFENKLAAEKLVLAFEFGAELDAGESLSGTPTVAVTVIYGVDASPEAILNGSPAIVGSDVLLPVKAGVAGVDYRILVTSETTNPNKLLARVGRLYVEP